MQVGLGPHGRNWARRVVPEIDEVELVAYVDNDPYALDALKEEAGVPAERCFESLTEAIAATHPEAVLNTTPLPAPAPLTPVALDAGLHVLLEKPFAPSVAEAKGLVDMAAELNLVLMVSQNYRFFPAPRGIASMVHESALGKLYAVEIDFRRYSTAGPDGQGRHHLEEQPPLVDLSMHHFDPVRVILLRQPRRFVCDAWHPGWIPLH